MLITTESGAKLQEQVYFYKCCIDRWQLRQQPSNKSVYSTLDLLRKSNMQSVTNCTIFIAFMAHKRLSALPLRVDDIVFSVCLLSLNSQLDVYTDVINVQWATVGCHSSHSVLPSQAYVGFTQEDTCTSTKATQISCLCHGLSIQLVFCVCMNNIIELLLFFFFI